MDGNNESSLVDEFLRNPGAVAAEGEATISEEEQLEVEYPLESAIPENDDEAELNALVAAALQQEETPAPHPTDPIGYVSNARNAASRSDAYPFWSSGETASAGIGSLVRHEAADPNSKQSVQTYGIVTSAQGLTSGLDDFAIHVYEKDGRPIPEQVILSNSRRRAVVNYEARVLASSQDVERPVFAGPVYPVTAPDMASLHNQSGPDWPNAEYFLLGFYQDPQGNFGAFAEERARVLGPKQGHAILSGLPGAGKTSLFLTLVIALYGQLRDLEGNDNDNNS